MSIQAINYRNLVPLIEKVIAHPRAGQKVGLSPTEVQSVVHVVRDAANPFTGKSVLTHPLWAARTLALVEGSGIIGQEERQSAILELDYLRLRATQGRIVHGREIKPGLRVRRILEKAGLLEHRIELTENEVERNPLAVLGQAILSSGVVEDHERMLDMEALYLGITTSLDEISPEDIKLFEERWILMNDEMKRRTSIFIFEGKIILKDEFDSYFAEKALLAYYRECMETHQHLKALGAMGLLVKMEMSAEKSDAIQTCKRQKTEEAQRREEEERARIKEARKARKMERKGKGKPTIATKPTPPEEPAPLETIAPPNEGKPLSSNEEILLRTRIIAHLAAGHYQEALWIINTLEKMGKSVEASRQQYARSQSRPQKYQAPYTKEDIEKAVLHPSWSSPRLPEWEGRLLGIDPYLAVPIKYKEDASALRDLGEIITENGILVRCSRLKISPHRGDAEREAAKLTAMLDTFRFSQLTVAKEADDENLLTNALEALFRDSLYQEKPEECLAALHTMKRLPVNPQGWQIREDLALLLFHLRNGQWKPAKKALEKLERAWKMNSGPGFRDYPIWRDRLAQAEEIVDGGDVLYQEMTLPFLVHVVYGPDMKWKAVLENPTRYEKFVDQLMFKIRDEPWIVFRGTNSRVTKKTIVVGKQSIQETF